MIETTVSTETLTGISLPPKTILGYRVNGEPIYNIAGGDGRVAVESDDDDDDDDTDATDENDDDDDAKPEEDSWTPPSKEDFEKLLAAKQKADSEAAARKRFLRDAGLDPKTGKAIPKREVKIDLGFGTDEEDDDEPQDKGPSKDDLVRTQREVQRQVEREIAKAEQNERRRATALISAVPTALEEAGWNGRNMPRMLKLLDLDNVEVDSDGEVDGLQDQIDELKKDFPEFFKRQRMKDAAKEASSTKTVGGGAKQAPASEEHLDFATRIRNQLLNGK
mgnify:CR=1 FL=1